MTVQEIHFRDYGHGGDHIGSRRTRRAFRYCATACVAFTAILCFSEQFLRHEQTERLYIIALLQENPSAARAFLRQAVKIDAKQREVATPKYLDALAGREEDDLVLSTYQSAYTLDPENASLAIRFGCRLAQDGWFNQAIELFQKAAENDPENALPVYLEASVQPWAEENNKDLRRSLALIAKANSSELDVRFPRPMWSSDLPPRGYWYAQSRRQLVLDLCTPLMQYANYVCGEAEQAISQGRVQYWDSWLERIELMGRRVAEGAIVHDPAKPPLAGGAEQALAGIRIQIKALSLRERILEGGTSDASAATRLKQLEEAARRLSLFSDELPARIAREKRTCRLPVRLSLQTLALVFLIYILACILSRLACTGKQAWTMPHTSATRSILAFGVAGVFFLLMLTWVFHVPLSQETWRGALIGAWRLLVTVILAYGVIFPVFMLPLPKNVAGALEDASVEVLSQARKQYRCAFTVFWRRYFGIVLGSLAMAICAWIICHRVLASLYPWQIQLLASGFAKDETRLVIDVLSSLR